MRGCSCNPSACNPIDLGPGNGGRIAIDASRVYWTDSSGGNVMSAAKMGGAATTIASNEGDVDALAVDDTWVYFANHKTPAIRRAKGGGPATTIVTTSTGVNAIAFDGATLYAGLSGTFNGIAMPNGDAQLVSAPAAGGQPTVLQDKQPGPVVDVAIRNGTVFFAYNKTVRALPLGGSARDVGTTTSDVVALATTTAAVVFAEPLHVFSAPLAGGMV